jgi:hypothetical protein
MTEEAHDDLYVDGYTGKQKKVDHQNAMGKDLKQSNGKLDTETQIYTETIEKRAVKSSVLTKGIGKHTRYSKSGQGAEHSRHLRTSSVGSNVMTMSNNYGTSKGYAKLADQTFKSGDFTKMKTEIEEIELDPGVLNGHVELKGHRRRVSAIKKVSQCTCLIILRSIP